MGIDYTNNDNINNINRKYWKEKKGRKQMAPNLTIRDYFRQQSFQSSLEAYKHIEGERIGKWKKEFY